MSHDVGTGNAPRNAGCAVCGGPCREGECQTRHAPLVGSECVECHMWLEPFYRVWGGQRGRYVVMLYREP